MRRVTTVSVVACFSRAEEEHPLLVGEQLYFDDTSDEETAAKSPAAAPPAVAQPSARLVARLQARLSRATKFANHLNRELGKRVRELNTAHETCKRLRAESNAAQAELQLEWSQRVNRLEWRVTALDRQCADFYTRGREEGYRAGFTEGRRTAFPSPSEHARESEVCRPWVPTPTFPQFLSNAQQAAARIARRRAGENPFAVVATPPAAAKPAAAAKPTSAVKPAAAAKPAAAVKPAASTPAKSAAPDK